VDADEKHGLGERLTNVVENLACRVAEARGGRITANHLASHLPMSLDMIRSVLDAMADGSAVLTERQANITEYVFSAYLESPERRGLFKTDSCLSCARELVEGRDGVLCSSCSGEMRSELDRLAERTGWPARAVYEHEALFLAAGKDDAVHAEELAARSRYTLRSMRRKLERMSLEGVVTQELDPEAGLIKYRFPKIIYPKEDFRRNMAVITSHPASVMEEVELKVVRIAIALALMVVAAFVLAFMRVPFPILLAALLVAAPVTSILIWRHRTRPEED
jgi:hypothetical protein